jgi:hypothetical protein
MTAPDWWYAGLFAGFIIFFCLTMLLTWWLLRWGTRQVDKLDMDIKQLEESQRMFQQDLRMRWGDDDGK